MTYAQELQEAYMQIKTGKLSESEMINQIITELNEDLLTTAVIVNQMVQTANMAAQSAGSSSIPLGDGLMILGSVLGIGVTSLFGVDWMLNYDEGGNFFQRLKKTIVSKLKKKSEKSQYQDAMSKLATIEGFNEMIEKSKSMRDDKKTKFYRDWIEQNAPGATKKELYATALQMKRDLDDWLREERKKKYQQELKDQQDLIKSIDSSGLADKEMRKFQAIQNKLLKKKLTIANNNLEWLQSLKK